jgi:hypothetical protein
MNTLKLLFISALLLLVSACGGGGGGGASGPVTSTNTFDVRAGWSRLIANGFSKTFVISGTCSGTDSLTVGPANTSTTFEGSPALSSNYVDSVTLTNCTPASSVGTVTEYYDSNYVPLGLSVLGGKYEVWAAPPTIPVAARVGDVGIFGTINKYNDSTKAVSAGRQDNSYVIEADTATSAIANFISKNYNTSNVLTSTEQDRYRVAADGSLTLISIDIQYANGSTTHLIMN